MNDNVNAQERPRVGSLVPGARKLCLWLAGMPADEVLRHRMDTQMRYTAAGLVIGVWYLLMCVVWAKSGYSLFGVIGSFALLLMPTLMLGLDRMIISHPRNPAGVLAAYSVPGLGVGRVQVVARFGCAIAFSLASTSLFLIDQNRSDINAQQRKDHFVLNGPIRDEALARLNAAAVLQKQGNADAIQQLNSERTQASAEYDKAHTIADEAEARYRDAKFNSEAEAGGIEGRVAGRHVRFRAYEKIALQSKDDAVSARARESTAHARLQKADAELKAMQATAETALAEFNSAKKNIDEEVRQDSRYVPQKSGLFADATTLLRLYGDKQIGPGLSAFTIIVVLVLIVMEMGPLIACSLLPITAFDVERVARERADAALTVAQHELHVVDAHARRTVHVRDIGDHEQRARDRQARNPEDQEARRGFNTQE
jgi:hypothetical protein